jgi:hypothetical protein
MKPQGSKISKRCKFSTAMAIGQCTWPSAKIPNSVLLDMYMCIHVRDKGIYSRGI